MLSEDVVDASIAEILVTLASKSTDDTEIKPESNGQNENESNDDYDDESDTNEANIDSLIKGNNNKLFDDLEAMRYFH